MSSARKRKNIMNPNKGKAVFHLNKDHGSENEGSGVAAESYSQWLRTFSAVAGVVAMVYCGYIHSWFMYTLHENNMWFTNIKEVEREISFRTESGLYYSYYKQMVQSSSLSEGIHDLMQDQLTEYPDTINVLKRMNIYQEVILATLYRILPVQLKEEAIFFYIKSVFALHGVLVAALFTMTWLLANSWLAGILAAAFYSLNRLDTTRVEYTIPLRESFALPFVWIQGAALTYYFKASAYGWKQRMSVVLMGLSTFLFCLFWQFNQFIMLLQAFALFGVWILDVLPARKVQTVLATQALSLLAVCLLQFGNRMILGSLVLSFIAATFILMSFRFVLQVEADEHIFKFLQSKFSGEETRDFDSRLYLCLSIFGFLTMDVYQRLTKGFVLPFYILAHLGLLIALLLDVVQQWRVGQEVAGNFSYEEVATRKGKNDSSVKKNKLLLLETRPELVFHTVQCVFFGALAITTLRMKYLWTPYMCVLSAVILADHQVWSGVLSLLKSKSTGMVDAFRHTAVAVVLALLLLTTLPTVFKDLEELREFWDPDTVELMEWIQKNTAPMASFTGSMQLMAGVKLCTGRPINNHPHYEDKNLRYKTKELYQVYGRRTSEDVHNILTKLGSHYIILEDSICKAPSKNNCRTPDIIDLDNGVCSFGSWSATGS